MKNLLLASMLFTFSSIVCHAQDTAAIRLALGEKDYKNYMDWVALGVGGLPHTLEGYRTVEELGKQLTKKRGSAANHSSLCCSPQTNESTQ